MHSLSVKRARKESGGRRGKAPQPHSFGVRGRERRRGKKEPLLWRLFRLSSLSPLPRPSASVPRMGPSLVHSPLEIRSPSRYQDVPRIGGWRRRTANGNGAGRQTPGVEDQCDRISGAVGWWRGSLPLSKFFKIRICELRIRHDEVCTLFIIE